ncbi:hypothetical protein PPTG_17724 [Phytophthora nicotianae INRA-310]|uniref:Uncharacterized protein n=1 Tax=Phytophthora nicotianae (strain INRA-310) TaxID=761204 RepID=W2PIB7_PHYN3|nr:hypothetical protein PPTG_17724 [Phytophthora nicotianae INRA-310]ETN00753.1 hypothetical protein PPTG_17724 [Phytophthora nicotianae INRA-310]
MVPLQEAIYLSLFGYIPTEPKEPPPLQWILLLGEATSLSCAGCTPIATKDVLQLLWMVPPLAAASNLLSGSIITVLKAAPWRLWTMPYNLDVPPSFYFITIIGVKAARRVDLCMPSVVDTYT